MVSLDNIRLKTRKEAIVLQPSARQEKRREECEKIIESPEEIDLWWSDITKPGTIWKTGNNQHHHGKHKQKSHSLLSVLLTVCSADQLIIIRYVNKCISKSRLWSILNYIWTTWCSVLCLHHSVFNSLSTQQTTQPLMPERQQASLSPPWFKLKHFQPPHPSSLTPGELESPGWTVRNSAKQFRKLGSPLAANWNICGKLINFLPVLSFIFICKTSLWDRNGI